MAATKAFVLIETTVGKTKDVVSALHKVDGVTSVDVVTGPYDVIVQLDAEDLDQLGQCITAELQAIDGVQRTTTCLAVSLG